MLDQAYRVIRTLETTIAALVAANVGTSSGSEVKCPFCKADKLILQTRTRKITARANLRNPVMGVTTKRVLNHAKDCEVILLLEDMEEWGCHP
jgi:hypothetical protein